MLFLFCNEAELIREAEIQCKFPSASQELRHIGEYFKNMITLNFQPYFIIGEKGSFVCLFVCLFQLSRSNAARPCGVRHG